MLKPNLCVRLHLLGAYHPVVGCDDDGCDGVCDDGCDVFCDAYLFVVKAL